MGAAASGPFTVYANDAKLSIPKTGAGAVFVKLTFNGEVGGLGRGGWCGARGTQQGSAPYPRGVGTV